MSSGGEARRGLSLQEAAEQLRVLEEQIAQLQAAIADIEARMAQLSSLEDALADLREGSEDTLVPLDPRATVLVRAKVLPVEKAVIHAGLNIFVEVPREKALEVVREERASLSKLAEAYRGELAKLSEYYSALRAAVEQALQQAVARAGGRQ